MTGGEPSTYQLWWIHLWGQQVANPLPTSSDGFICGDDRWRTQYLPALMDSFVMMTGGEPSTYQLWWINLWGRQVANPVPTSSGRFICGDDRWWTQYLPALMDSFVGMTGGEPSTYQLWWIHLWWWQVANPVPTSSDGFICGDNRWRTHYLPALMDSFVGMTGGEPSTYQLWWIHLWWWLVANPVPTSSGGLICGDDRWRTQYLPALVDSFVGMTGGEPSTYQLWSIHLWWRQVANPLPTSSGGFICGDDRWRTQYLPTLVDSFVGTTGGEPSTYQLWWIHLWGRQVANPVPTSSDGFICGDNRWRTQYLPALMDSFVGTTGGEPSTYQLWWIHLWGQQVANPVPTSSDGFICGDDRWWTQYLPALVDSFVGITGDEPSTYQLWWIHLWGQQVANPLPTNSGGFICGDDRWRTHYLPTLVDALYKDRLPDGGRERTR